MNTEDKNWEVLHSEYLFRHPWLTARRDHVKLPTGTEIPEYYILEYPDWVNVIAITNKGKFVMIRQYRHGIRETRYELCAGVIDAGETPLEAAKRELYEETGFGGGEWSKFMTSCPNPSAMTNTNHTFLAIGVEQISTQHLESTEDISVHLLEKEEVVALLRDDLIRQSLMAAPLWKYISTC